MNQGPYQPYNNQQPPYNQPPYSSNTPPPYTPQQPQRGFRQWFRSRRRRTKFALGFGSLFVILFLCICSLAAYGSTLPSVKTIPSPTTSTVNNSDNQSTPVALTATAVVTATPSPTAIPTTTPKPSPTIASKPTSTNTGAAVLGGSLNAFITKFGQPNDHSSSGMAHLNRCNNSNIDQIILLQISTNTPVMSVDVQACTDTSWTTSFANAYCSTFLPTDAKYQRSVQIPGSSSQFASVDKIYYSATLAHEFTADNFTDASGNAVKPGLFDVYFLYSSNSDTTHIGSCQLQLGTQQTQG